MREAFYEESAISRKGASEAKKYMILHVISIVFLVAAAIHIFFSFSAVIGYISKLKGLQLAFALVQWFGLLAVLVALFFLFWKMKKRYNLSYDYTFVEDELRISKVFNGKKRKFLITLKADQILKIGLCENDSFERTIAGLSKKAIVYCTPNEEPAEEKMFIYIIYTSTLGKTAYILECREMLLNYVVRAAGRNKFETR